MERTISIVEHLGEDDVGSSVDLLLKVLHLLLGRLAISVPLGESRNLDTRRQLNSCLLLWQLTPMSK